MKCFRRQFAYLYILVMSASVYWAPYTIPTYSNTYILRKILSYVGNYCASELAACGITSQVQRRSVSYQHVPYQDLWPIIITKHPRKIYEIWWNFDIFYNVLRFHQIFFSGLNIIRGKKTPGMEPVEWSYTTTQDRSMKEAFRLALGSVMSEQKLV